MASLDHCDVTGTVANERDGETVDYQAGHEWGLLLTNPLRFGNNQPRRPS